MRRLRIFGVIGWTNSGKTTLIERLVRHLRADGLRVSTVKHAHHGFDLDRPGKDSYRHREAGAEEVLISAAGRWALLRELPEGEEASLATLLERLTPVDLVLVEGFKGDPHPKLEVIRVEEGAPLRMTAAEGVRAYVSNEPSRIVDLAAGLPVFGREAIGAIAGFVFEHAAAPGDLRTG